MDTEKNWSLKINKNTFVLSYKIKIYKTQKRTKTVWTSGKPHIMGKIAMIPFKKYFIDDIIVNGIRHLFQNVKERFMKLLVGRCLKDLEENFTKMLLKLF